jgi:hypothetical protein
MMPHASGRFCLLVALTLCAGGCALTRSEVKGLRDPGAARIQFEAPIRTTIAALNALPPHCGPAGNRRVRDEEFRVYQVVGRITRVKREPDHDVHLVLEDPERRDARLVVELADPDHRGNVRSPYRANLAAAKRMLDELAAQSASGKLGDLNGMMVRVTGVGFFDLHHFQRGRSRSCIELHPVLVIEKGDKIGTREPR